MGHIWKPNVANILLFKFCENNCEKQFTQHGSTTCAIDCNGLSFLIFEENWSNYASESKSAPNSDSFWVRWLFKVCVRVFCAPNAPILLVYMSAKIKISFIWKDDFLPKSASSVSRSQTHLAKHCSSVYTNIFVRRKDKTDYLSNQTWAKCYHSRNKQ